MRIWLVIALVFVVLFAKKNNISYHNKMHEKASLFVFDKNISNIIDHAKYSMTKQEMSSVFAPLGKIFQNDETWVNARFLTSSTQSNKRLLFLSGQASSLLLLLSKESKRWCLQDTITLSANEPVDFKILNSNSHMGFITKGFPQQYYFYHVVQDSLCKVGEMTGNRQARKGDLVTRIITNMDYSTKTDDINFLYDIQMNLEAEDSLSLVTPLFQTKIAYSYHFDEQKKMLVPAQVLDSVQVWQLSYIDHPERYQQFFKAFNNEINLIFEGSNQQQRDRLLMLKSFISGDTISSHTL